MPRSASAVGLAKRGVIPRKQFYTKLFFYNTVILTRCAGIRSSRRSFRKVVGVGRAVVKDRRALAIRGRLPPGPPCARSQSPCSTACAREKRTSSTRPSCARSQERALSQRTRFLRGRH